VLWIPSISLAHPRSSDLVRALSTDRVSLHGGASSSMVLVPTAPVLVLCLPADVDAECTMPLLSLTLPARARRSRLHTSRRQQLGGKATSAAAQHEHKTPQHTTLTRGAATTTKEPANEASSGAGRCTRVCSVLAIEANEQMTNDGSQLWKMTIIAD
jgi:hypothetical protein